MKINRYDVKEYLKSHAEPPSIQRTGTLQGVAPAQIDKLIGFKGANGPDETTWWFVADDKVCGIWSYRGSGASSHWYTSGPDQVFAELFGECYSRG